MKMYKSLFVSGISVIAFTLGLSFLAFGGFLKIELFFCWIVNFFNAYLSALISRKAVGRKANSFLMWALLGHGMRFGLIIIAIFYAIVTQMGDQMAIVALTLTGFIIFMVGEVLALHQMETKSDG